MISTTVQYLSTDDLYKREKPYVADFEVERRDGAKKTNVMLSSLTTSVQPVGDFSQFDINTHGFCIIKAQTSLTLEDALNKSEDIESSYHTEIETILHRSFPEYKRLEAIDFVVRSVDARFPSDDTGIVKYEQPACLAHSDYSVSGAIEQLKGSFPGQEAYFEGRDYDMINVWKPLIGPNNHWPIAICDFTSVEPDDIVEADVLHADRVVENVLLLPNQRHRWYYVRDQQPDDLIVFRNVDSSGKRARGFHCAVSNPDSNGPARTSVEVRFVAFR